MIDTREPVTTGAPGNPLELVYGDDGGVVTVNGTGFAQLKFSRLLENNKMMSDLDCGGHDLLHISRMVPVPFPLVDTSDPRLSDKRQMLPGSVTNESVAQPDRDFRGIQQRKLNLNGNIPPNYLAGPNSLVTTGDPKDPLEAVTDDAAGLVTVGGYSVPQPFFQYATQGNLAEYLQFKGALNGYCPLDPTGRMPASCYPVTGVGTVTHVGLDLPDEFDVSPDFIDHGTSHFDVDWADAPAESFFGGAPDRPGGGMGGILLPNAVPGFHNELPVALVPNLDASKITSGVFSTSRMPIAAGVGPSHALGVVPDPGATGSQEDYLARDMTYKRMAPPPNYEPFVPSPSIVFQYWRGVEAALRITDSLSDADCFYRVNFHGQFIPVLDATVFVSTLGGVTVEAYAACPGYNNSEIVSLFIPEHRL